MKKNILYTLVALLLPITLYCNTIQYDSLRNIDKSNVELLVGQTIIFPKGEYNMANIFWKNKKGSIYHPKKGDSKKFTQLSYIVDNHLDVIDIINSKKGLLLQVTNRENKETLFLNCERIFSYTYPPVFIQGFYEKMKELHEGKTVYLRGKHLNNDVKKHLPRLLNSDIFIGDSTAFFFQNTKEGLKPSIRIKKWRLDLADSLIYLATNSEVEKAIQDYKHYMEQQERLAVQKLEQDELARKEKERVQNINNELYEKYAKNKKYYRYVLYRRLNTDIPRFVPLSILKIEYLNDRFHYVTISFQSEDGRIFSVKSQYNSSLKQLDVFDKKEPIAGHYEFSKLPPRQAFPKVRHWNEIHKGEVKIGMTTTEVELSWGITANISSSEYSNLYFEHWIYSDKDASLMFKNGRLENISYY
ncbi:hypothetical protein LJC29_01530 [Bacteroides sp. OttesenSCG-928-N06]|nr:hypothetical protein [Bacteroides sp. OttesenSCG-928-N06]